MTRTILMILARVGLAAAVVSIVGIMLIYHATEPATLNWLNKPPAVFR